MSDSNIKAFPGAAARNPNDEATAAALKLLEEIASQASALRLLISDAYGRGAEDLATIEALIAATEIQVGRIGWIAELAHEKLGGAPFITGATASDWMLPQSLARAVRDSQPTA